MAKSAGRCGTVVMAGLVVIGVVWIWQDQASFVAFMNEVVSKIADLITAVFDAISREIQERSAGGSA